MNHLRIIAHCFLICCFLPILLNFYTQRESNDFAILTPIYMVVLFFVLTRFMRPSETKIYKWSLVISLIVGIGIVFLNTNIAAILIFHCFMVIFYERMDKPSLSTIIINFHTFCIFLWVWVTIQFLESLSNMPGIPDN